MPKYVIGVLLEMSHVINNTTNKSIVLNRLLDQIKQFKNMFSNMKKISTIMLNEPTKIHHKHMFSNMKKSSNIMLNEPTKIHHKQSNKERNLYKN